MQIIHEEVEFSDGIPLNISIKKMQNSPKHWHNCIELCLVLSGSLNITLEAESYHLYEDDIILFNSDQLHQIQSEDNVVITLMLDLSFYKKGLEKDIYFLCNSAAYHNKKKFLELKRLIAKIIYIHYNDTEGNVLLTMSYSYLLLLELIKNFKSTKKKSLTCTSKNLQRLGDVIQHLSENYAEEITLEQVAERTFLSPSYLSHFFKVNMNVSFFNYLTGIRLHHAVDDLLSTTLSIEQIAANNGFANSRYLVIAFKKQYNMLPREYRSKYKKEETIDKEKEKRHPDYNQYLMLKQHNFLNKLGEYLEFDSEKENKTDANITTKASIEADATSKLRNLSHTFRTFTGVGRAKELLLESVQQQLKTIQKEVGFRYLKFHGILDDAMMLYNEDHQGKPYLTHLYVDQVIDFLLSIQLRPLIQLSFMPRALAKDPYKTLFYNPVIISEPKDYTKWAFLITNLTNHFIERYGLEEVRQWMFCFWNVPFSSYIFAFETNEIGYELYRLTRSCVKACDNQLLFGSPSYGSMNFTGHEIYEFLDFCNNNDCYPDFYNLNYYPVQSSTGKDLINFGEHANRDTIILSDDSDNMKEAIVSFKVSLSNYKKLPIYITEWASSTSHREWLNDTCYRSAYIVKNVLDNYDQVGSFGNWCLSDLLEELPYDEDVFHGELGLFTVNGIKKPAYYAFTFLNKLMNTLVAQGNGYFITTNQKGDYAILLYNYIHFSPLYAQGVLFNVTFLERYNAFVNPAPLEIDIKLLNTENACYTLTEHIVNRDYGSAFDEWIRMGAVALRTEEEINTLRGRSMPKITKTNMEVRNNQINYYVTLEPHEIRLITLHMVKKKGSNGSLVSQREIFCD